MFTLFVESLRSAFVSINARPLRSILTTLGIIIGVSSIIILVSILQGLSYNIMQKFGGLGSNNLTITSMIPFEEVFTGQSTRLTPKDLEQIRLRVNGISAITPIFSSQLSVISKSPFSSQSTFTRVQGTTHTYQDVAQLYTVFGRFLTDSDNQTRRRVCVIGEHVRSKLSLPENPVGQFIEINGEWIKIIGLMEKKGELLGANQDDYVLLPFKTMQSVVGSQTLPQTQILLTIKNIKDMGFVKDRVRRILRDSHKLESKGDDFIIQTPEQLISTFTDLLEKVTFAMIGIVSISLLVGGIGIMNTMLVSVSERTREIGICKAIGAKRYHILLQFLVESLILCVLGGLIGLLVGYAFGILISTLPNFPPAHLPLWAVALSIGFSILVGVISGIIPAVKAANLDPISSLRYE